MQRVTDWFSALIRGSVTTTLLSALALLVVAPAAADEKPPLPPEVAAYLVDKVPDWADGAAIEQALLDAGDNWPELAAALERCLPGADRAYDELDYRNMVWLVGSAPHLDRLELTSDILLENLDEALRAARQRGYDRDSDFFRRYVLNYRLDDEPVTAWRAELAARYAGQADGLTAILWQVTDGFSEYERGYYGNLASPLGVDNARAGTARELAILAAAALRSQGYATRFVREGLSGKTWVEVYTGDPVAYEPVTWSPVFPTSPEHSGETTYALELCGGRIAVVTAGDAFGYEQVTSRYSDICAVVPSFTRAGESVEGFEHWSITAWHEGRYVPLDDLGYPWGDVDPPAGGVFYVGAPGEYRLQCGVRYPGGVIHTQYRDFSAEPGGRVEISLVLDAPPDLLPAALAERRVEWPLEGETLEPDRHLIVIYDEGEPSQRALAILEPYSEDPRVYTQFLPVNPDSAELADWIRDDLKVKEDDLKPVVILVIRGETIIYRRGYDLSIGDWIERALAADE